DLDPVALQPVGRDVERPRGHGQRSSLPHTEGEAVCRQVELLVERHQARCKTLPVRQPIDVYLTKDGRQRARSLSHMVALDTISALDAVEPTLVGVAQLKMVLNELPEQRASFSAHELFQRLMTQTKNIVACELLHQALEQRCRPGEGN